MTTRPAPKSHRTAALLDTYVQTCGRTLARGHARSGDRVAIAVGKTGRITDENGI